MLCSLALVECSISSEIGIQSQRVTSFMLVCTETSKTLPGGAEKPQAMSYGERKAAREQEIAGLKEALTILSGESLLQVKTTLRGARRVSPEITKTMRVQEC